MIPEPAIVRDGLAVYRIGAGEPILFMPGPHRFERPGLRTADALIEGLRELGRRVVTFDPPGSGASTRPARLGLEEMLDTTDEALDSLGLVAPIDALGHSMGGFTLIAYALARPARIRRLVLVGTGAGGYLDAPGALWHRGHRAFVPMALLGILQMLWPRLGPEQLLRNLIERESFVDRRLARQVPVHARDWLRPPAGRTDWHRVARRLDFRDRLDRIAVPTLILCGRHDPQFPPACSAVLAERIPDARTVWFERSGHDPFIEEPTAFWAAVGGFLTTGPDVEAAEVDGDAIGSVPASAHPGGS